jgi:hypothetical protein
MCVETKARKLQQQTTLDIKNRQGAVLCRSAESIGLFVCDSPGIVLNQGKVQSSFRKNYR